ncbi:MAG: hypothetical protein GWN84_01075 [Gammaproteobacteria bacterium]|nr:hypothetical protein [Gammaproteobacteria bacterium]NIR58738.1 hypothetical protein [Gammaproteobacteria bacterium]NIR88592.1 hypothetical protein [Gammaproteobacteria bacterium]
MSAEEQLGKYAEGWTKGDAKTILAATTESYVFDDPNAGQVAREDFDAYLQGLKEAVAEARGEQPDTPFMALSDIVTQADDEILTAWCWWSIPGTGLQGSGLIKADARGVFYERIAYYTRLP